MSDCKTRPKVILIEKSKASMHRLASLFMEIIDSDLLMYDNPKDALEQIGSELPDLLVMEWELHGVITEELLKSLKSHHALKDIPVIICTANQDLSNKRRALELGAHEYLTKPVGRSELRKSLAELFDNEVKSSSGNGVDRLDNGGIESELRRVVKLGPLPAMVEKILSITGDPDSSAHSLTQAIRADQALTAKILQIVNSAYYGFHREIGNIDHAVVILGFDEIVNITITACIIGNFTNDTLPNFDRDDFWLHSFGTGNIARALRAHIPDVISLDAFVIGLLHDIGKLIFAQYFPEQFTRVLEEAHESKRPLHLVANEQLGYDHAEIGGLLADQWNLPPQLVNAIRYHHRPEKAGSSDLTIHLAHLANYFSHKYEIGSSGNPVPDAVNRKTLEIFGMADKDLDEVWTGLNIDVEGIKQILSTVKS